LTLISHSPEETQSFGKDFAKNLNEMDIVAVYGELGAGKTQLIKGICAKLGVKETVNSPTFIIVNEYSSHRIPKIFHFDFYRMKSLDEILNMGFPEYVGKGLVLIEWPELVSEILPKGTKRVEIKHTGKNEFEREIKM